MKKTWFTTVIFACLLVTVAPFASAEETTRSPLEAARRLGDIQRLRELSNQRDDAEALVARAELALLDADIEGAKRFATTALERATEDVDAELATVMLARAEYANGNFDRSEELLRAYLSDHPQAHHVRLQLGRQLVGRGSKSEGEVVLDALSTFFNNSLLTTSDDLTVLSKAMATIGSYDDANFAMEKAIEANPKNAEALVHWGELLLEKYNTADAEVTFEEALGLNPNHVDALVGMARTELDLSNDYAKVRQYLSRAERIAPEHTGMLLTYAEVAVYDTDCTTARRFANRVLEHRPHNLEALTFLATCNYLDDDRAAFEKVKKRVFEVNPNYARVLTETARYAVRVHRYEEAVKLNREALELRPGFPPALLGIGIGLSRIGREHEAVEMLQRAFEADPYNVRAYNMVELYETQMRDYEFTEYDRFKLRAHRSEREIVNALVAPVVREALDTFDDKYRFEPSDDYLAVEIFPNPTTFAVRSVGLPHVSPHGICFGKVVVSRSPSEGNFNWRQVVWHELAHVYHIQMSNSRVPRWFTEGLAEYETNVKDPAWVRHHDRELARALNAGTLRKVLELSEGFTHARSFEEILRSYHQSSLVIHFIAQTWGFEALPQMLRTWGQFKTTTEVLDDVLEVTPDQFDARFEKWLSRRYLNFKRQLTVDLASLPPAEELESKLENDPENGRLWAELAIVRYRVGDVANADVAMTQATAYAGDEPTVSAIAALYYYDRGRVKDAYRHGIAVLDAGADSYDLRFLLGSAAMQLEDVESAHVHFTAATTLWEDGKEAWKGLAKVARALEDDELAARAQRRLFMLDQNDPQVARQHTETTQKRGEWNEALRASRRWIDINPTDSRAPEALIESARQAGELQRAVDAWSLLAVLRPGDSEDILLPAIESLAGAGHEQEARRLARQARQSDVPASKVDAALRR
jgi:tetratricopeptide (TPR) repeat protein